MSAPSAQPVAISFGHEMNGYWYSWGYRHTSPGGIRGRLAAHRHRLPAAGRGQRDLAVDGQHHRQARRHPFPAPWWPGNSFVNWVGIDGYYYKPSWRFAPLFGPTIRAVRALTLDPILITETAVAPAAGQPAKIADLFAGVRAYGLLGFVWFDGTGFRDWRLDPAPLLSPHSARAPRRHGDLRMHDRPAAPVARSGTAPFKESSLDRRGSARLKPRPGRSWAPGGDTVNIMAICAVIIAASVFAVIAAFSGQVAGGKPFDPAAPPLASAPVARERLLGVHPHWRACVLRRDQILQRSCRGSGQQRSSTTAGGENHSRPGSLRP